MRSLAHDRAPGRAYHARSFRRRIPPVSQAICRARFAGVLALLFTLAAQAAVDPAQFSDLSWRLIGPFRGGRVLAVTGVPNDAARFYFGAVNGGVWETKDAGRT